MNPDLKLRLETSIDRTVAVDNLFDVMYQAYIYGADEEAVFLCAS